MNAMKSAPRMTSLAPCSFLYYPTPRVVLQVTYISRPMASLPAFRALWLGSALFLPAACGRQNRPASDERSLPPAAEFLLATQDSTFWVATRGDKIRVRGAPIILAQYDGRFFEVYLADDDRSYHDALFVGLRVYRRDLQQGDSTLVF